MQRRSFNAITFISTKEKRPFLRGIAFFKTLYVYTLPQNKVAEKKNLQRLIGETSQLKVV